MVVLLGVIAFVIVVLVRRHQYLKPAASNTPGDNDISDDARYVDAGDIDPLTRPADVLNQEPIGEYILAAYKNQGANCKSKKQKEYTDCG